MKAMVAGALIGLLLLPGAAVSQSSVKSERCAVAGKWAAVALLWWKRGGTRTDIQRAMRPADDVSAEEYDWATYWIDQSYISISSILARNGMGHEIDDEAFADAMFDVCMARK